MHYLITELACRYINPWAYLTVRHLIALVNAKVSILFVLSLCVSYSQAQNILPPEGNSDGDIQAINIEHPSIESPAIIVTPESAAKSQSALNVLTESSSVMPVQFKCTHKQQVRLIYLMFPSGKALPCQVDYHKLTESDEGRKTIWFATQSLDYCELKIEQMLDRLENWGWDCNED